MITRFGPAGTADSFKAMGYKKAVQLPEYLEKFGVNAFEYQCGRGVRVNVDTVTQLGTLCREKDIALSAARALLYFTFLGGRGKKKIIQSAIFWTVPVLQS